jgi:phospholipid/cholesterol/gamma-HCH transport system substrate-binding protein
MGLSMISTGWRRSFRDAGLGLVLLVVLALIFSLVVAIFNQALTRSVSAVVPTSRVGLLLEPNSFVTFRGIQVGSVADVRTTPHGAEITLRIQPDYAKVIPANSIAAVKTSTLFGPKSVDLQPPATAAAGPLTDGDTLASAPPGVEINTAFDSLMSVLNTVQPAKVNATLTALAVGLQGRGEQAGVLAEQLRGYLRELIPSLPALKQDFVLAGGVLNTYADAAPDLLSALSNITVTSHTVVDEQARLGHLLIGLKSVGHNAKDFLGDNEHSIPTTLSVLAPTARLLARYAPEYPCLFKGIDANRRMWEKTIGGNGVSTLITLGVQPGDDPYRYPQDLSKVAASGGPVCDGLPTLPPGGPATRHVVTDSGTDPYAGTKTPQPGTPPIALLLFGPLAPGVGK